MSVLTPIFSTLTRMPISVRKQAVLAEVLSQLLATGMGTERAFWLASIHWRGWRVRRGLERTVTCLQAGQPLLHSVILASLPLHPDLRAALDVGEERGHLAVELAAAARRLDPQVDRHLAAAVGRSPAAIPFAAALARLLTENPLTVRVIRDAARLVGLHNKRFWHAITCVADDMESDSEFSESLARHRRVFDVFFTISVEHADSRESLRRVLARLGNGTDRA